MKKVRGSSCEKGRNVKVYSSLKPQTATVLCLVMMIAYAGLFGTITQASGQEMTPPDDGSQITVSLVTFGPGEEFWQRFGHNAIWVRDPVREIDTLYNYGRFNFEKENFILQFIQGHMRYWLEAQNPASTFQFYTSMNRSIYLQELALTPTQRLDLRNFLEWNLKPENVFYDYNYYRNNCSTRLRDVINRVLHGEMKRQTHAVPTHATFRFHTQRLTTQSPWLYTGLLLALGHSVDRPITLWEDMFIPMTLREHIRTVNVVDDQGERVPLVARELIFFESAASLPDASSLSGVFWSLLGGVTLAILFLSLGRIAGHHGAARSAFAGLTGLWTFLIGVGGMILAGLWLLTDHLDAANNENLFFVTPLALPLAMLIPFAIYGREVAARPALILCQLLAGSALIGFVVQALSTFDQINGEIIALMLPPHIALWYALKQQLRIARTA